MEHILKLEIVWTVIEAKVHALSSLGGKGTISRTLLIEPNFITLPCRNDPDIYNICQLTRQMQVSFAFVSSFIRSPFYPKLYATKLK